MEHTAPALERPPDELDYASYLRLEELLGLQSARSLPEHPDELHFIITHQSIELCFKLLIADVRQVREVLEKERFTQAAAGIRRATAMMDATVTQLRLLRHLQPTAFHAFRPFLGTASGLQSVQFRVVEVLLGARDDEYLRTLAGNHRDGLLPAAVGEALAEPSLAETVLAAGERAGVADWALWYRAADPDSPLHLLCDALVDLDEAVFRWRCEHIILVQRQLGPQARGTADKTVSYLEATVRRRFFHFLWAARSALSEDSGAERPG